MFLADSWQDRSEKIEVLNPYDGRTIDTVPRASLSDVDAALKAASQGTHLMRKLSGFDRFKILKRAAEMVENQLEDLARTITLEEGKILAEARFEVSRAAETLMVSAEEAKRIAGEMVPQMALRARGTAWDLPCVFPVESFWRSVRSTSRSTWSHTKWDLLLRRETASFSNRRRTPHFRL